MTEDWAARARREAAAIITGAGPNPPFSYERVVELVALGYMHGTVDATHERLYGAEKGAQSLREALQA